jgi:MinD-like ATPase involved in chromosome partitioning or flagellar assembly
MSQVVVPELRFATSITREEVESNIVDAMAKLGWQVALRALDLTQVLQALGTEHIDLALVGGDRPDGATLIALMERGIRVVGVVDSPLAAPRFQAYGVADLIYYEGASQERLLRDLGALFRSSPNLRAQRASDSAGRFFCVTGAAGAPGRTSIALNLAMESADLGRSTLLAEIDRAGGTLAQQLGLINSASTLNRALTSRLPISQIAPAIAANFHVLTAPLQPTMMDEVDPDSAAELWRRARSEFEISVVDVGSVGDLFEISRVKRRVERLLIDALVQADEVLMVVRVDPQSVARTLRALDAISSELPEVPIRLIANRVPQITGRRRARGGFSTDEAMRAFAERSLVVHQVPLDLALFDRALNQGRGIAELAPRSQVRKAIRQIVQDVWQSKVA